MTASPREIVATEPGRPAPLPPPARRARTRRVLYLAGLLPALVVIAFSVKVLLMLHHDGAGEDAWRRGDTATALEQYAANRSLNLLEPWVAPFDEGDAAFALRGYPRARDLFITALRSVPHRQECTVRINLALAYEAIGDAAAKRGATDDATAAWQNGITALTDGDCPLHAGLGERQSHDAATVKQRLEDKQRTSAQQGQSTPKSRSQPSRPREDQDRLDKLEQRDRRGDQERRNYQDLQSYGAWGDAPQW
jgi:hypothetical protein